MPSFRSLSRIFIIKKYSERSEVCARITPLLRVGWETLKSHKNHGTRGKSSGNDYAKTVLRVIAELAV